MKIKRKDLQIGLALVLPAFIFIGAVSFFPLFHALQMSFYEETPPGKAFIGLEHYIEVVKDESFWLATKNSFVFTGFSVLLHFLLGLVFALLLFRISKGRILLRGMQFIPWLFPLTVVSCIWILIYHEQYGLITSILKAFGLNSLIYNWLGMPNTALIAIILANGWYYYAFFTLMILAGLETIPRSLFEAAAVDSAGGWSTFWNITLPHLKPVILTTSIIDIIWTFRSFDLVWIMTQGGPIHSSEIIPTYVYKEAFLSFNFNTAAAMGGLMVVFMLLFTLLYLYFYFSE